MEPVFIVVVSLFILVYLGHARADRPASLPPKLSGRGLMSSGADLPILLLVLVAVLVAILIAV